VADVVLFTVSVPELPAANTQLTGRFEEKVTVPFSPVEVAEGVMISPPLVTATTPVPVTGRSVGELGWLPVITSDAVSVCANEGLNEMEMVQLAPEGTVVPHVFEAKKSAAFAPLIVMLESVK
jgi:hypothetical protein